MKVLLDTNIIIHREANRVINKDIGLLFSIVEKSCCNAVFPEDTKTIGYGGIHEIQ